MLCRLLEKQHGDRVRLFPGGASRHPDPDGVVDAAGRKELGDDVLGQGLKSLGVTEECRDRDQQVGEQRLHFLDVLFQEREVVLQPFGLVDLRPPGDPAHDRRLLVMGKVVAGPGADVVENVLHMNLLVELRCRGDVALALGEVEEVPAHVGERKDEIRKARSNCAPRHRSVLGFARVLNQDNAAGLLDRLEANRSVRPRAGQHDGEAVAALLGERAEEQVDGCALPARLLEGAGRDVVVADLEATVGWGDVDMVGLERHRFTDLHHRHRGARRQDIRQLAAVLRREVHDDDEGNARLLWQGREKGLQRSDAAGRRTDAGHRGLSRPA